MIIGTLKWWSKMPTITWSFENDDISKKGSHPKLRKSRMGFSCNNEPNQRRYERHAHEMHAYEIHARRMHAHRMHAHRMHAYMPAREARERGTSIAYTSLSYTPCQIHIREMYACERHSH